MDKAPIHPYRDGWSFGITWLGGLPLPLRSCSNGHTFAESRRFVLPAALRM